MADKPQRGSPEWWRDKLYQRLQTRAPYFDELDRYDVGDHPLPEGEERAREMFRRFQAKARSNYTGLVVESVLERMNVVGFRSGGDSSPEVDKEAWRIWQANHLDADSDLVHRSVLALSHAYVIVGPNPRDDRTPIITPEDPGQVICAHDPVDRRTIRAALKCYPDDWEGGDVAVVLMPDAFYYWIKRDGKDWVELKPPAVNEIGVVPVVPFVNRPRLRRYKDSLMHYRGVVGDGMSELCGVLDVQDRINSTILDRLVVTKMQAYRQRWAKGIQTEDEEGNPLDLPFVPGVDLVWAVEDAEVEFGEFAQADLKPILDAVKDDIGDLAAISRTPPQYLLSGIVNVSGDALIEARAGLVAKVGQRIRYTSEHWERVMAIAGLYAGDKRLASNADTETLWADPESRTDAEKADAAVKKMAAGVPWRQRMDDLGYTPQQIERMTSERYSEMLMSAPQVAPAPARQALPAPEPAPQPTG